MVSTTASSVAGIPAADLESFQKHLQSSDRILALLGAGLSASSGLPTFRGAGGLWRTHDATSLATMEAFEADPGLVWQFYSYRRHMALKAKPNRAHLALAELAKKKPNFQTLSQNVDGLSQRAGHPPSQLHLLHGNLFDVKCSSFFCNHVEHNNFTDPIVPALAIPTSSSASPIDPTTNAARHELDISDPSTALPDLRIADLPACPACETGLLRPGVVWFGERLPRETIDAIDDFIDQSDRIDLIMVIGTSSTVYPAAGYAGRARAKGARVAVINVERTDALQEGDWFFQGDAGVVVPELLRGVVGEVGDGEGL
ncbi:Nad-dependent deacetylase sirtuin-5 [Lasiodiplodia theobromae]|uniref:Nad-dependent deacetylase sirtuin-5 n=1 Tax=Lasiodiplodia theobromae TaxID=45133 RepID=UPI0015C30A42|nr:Nad-dependent deacetylase sirtuin-5 [Lasiodiplodia theobromae]KAF4541257.1 Nad-dependent deacetylase sirtuin-5 [Lasiodiplodia theobromae]